MNTEQTISKMKELRLKGMLTAYQTGLSTGEINRYTSDEIVHFLVDAECNHRAGEKTTRLLKTAKFRYQSHISEISLEHTRGLDKGIITRLSTCQFIPNRENILISGSTGTGKSFIASAIGNQACLLGYKVMYFNINKLFSWLKMTKADGSYIKEIDKIEKQDLLILDDFGLHPIDAANRLTFLEIIEDRHGKRSTIITSQLPVHKWYEVIAEQTIADAILDRLIHTAHRLELKGESLRKVQTGDKNKKN
jgi:DNA replication protein DnaC